ncbi:MAG TPA: SGNH/GDSL hydrolase family protein [Gemmatimonadaceae bacterium]|nr:SGNH/GDSL hydrolase family protein [Gemmatimonadaceae bacterium]
MRRRGILPVRRARATENYYALYLMVPYGDEKELAQLQDGFRNRAIGGQTTPQMLVRFRQDVIALKPKVVVILAGTNDIAGNTGPSTLEMIENNLASMAELAKANGIRVVLASVLPVHLYVWRPSVRRPAQTLVALNQWIRDYARKNGHVYLDYHSAMADERLGMSANFSGDGVHPNEAGYRIMAPLTEAAIRRALRQD